MDNKSKIVVLQELRNEMLKDTSSKFAKKEEKKAEKSIEGKPSIMIRLMQLEGKK